MYRATFCISLVILSLLPPLVAIIEDPIDYVYIEDDVSFKNTFYPKMKNEPVNSGISNNSKHHHLHFNNDYRYCQCLQLHR